VETASPASPLHEPSRHRRKGELTRERILDAAEALFAERGFDGTTLRDVAACVGLRNPSLYNHFESKESLYAAVLERDIGPLFRLLARYVEQGRDASAAAAAEEVIASVMQVLTQRPALARLVQHETLSGGQRLTPMLRDYIVPLFAHGHEMAEDRALAAGWAKQDVPLLVLAMYHVVVGFFTMAPLYKALNGTDLLAEQAAAQQTRFMIELSERLFTPPSRPSR
jgi:AcrR family transcriptional regulator